MRLANRQRLYLLFFVSGFCSLLYQMVWTRLAFASFGIITPVLSVVLSVFMLGLSAGAWAGGRIIPVLTRKTRLSAIYFYGGAELLIGLGAFIVPKTFGLGAHWLLSVGQTNSFQYLALSALVLAAAILPWCVCMGATFPWMMAYIREQDPRNADSFSFLYVANVLGAMAGTLVTAFVFIELLGFHNTLAVAAVGNFGIAALAFALGKMGGVGAPAMAPTEPAPAPAPATAADGDWIRTILFTTGFCAMAMEVVWTRAFIPVLKTQVYSFALIVFTYLGATFAGSLIYRRDLRRGAPRPVGQLLALLALTAFVPIIVLDPRLLPAHLHAGLGNYIDSKRAIACVLASICPLCAALGYLTPSLIDQFSSGQPAAAGKAYGINVVGCIVGPLFASYILLPCINERLAMILLGLPLLGLGFLCRRSLTAGQRLATVLAAAAALGWSLFFAHDFEWLLQQREVRTTIRRDYAASVISFGEGFERMLLVNGVGMTTLTPETKFMVHLPLALEKERPKSALIICFGMGTSFRSALSWGLKTTVVELVPSVPEMFGFYHADAAAVLKDPNGRIVIDDGRRFLNRTRKKYDLIVVDPPPPVEAAGSSLLYTPEFYEAIKEHLTTNGIAQIWFPEGTKATSEAVVRSVVESFPYVHIIPGWSSWGAHFLGSLQPLQPTTGREMAARMPLKARQDLMEWFVPKDFPSVTNAPNALQFIMSRETNPSKVVNPDPRLEITDDRPFNEYYLLRQWGFYNP